MCDTCFKHKIKTLTFSASCFPTTGRGRSVLSTDKEEKQFDKDAGAYKRMYKSGLRPKSTKGAARLESEAQVPYEVESGQLAHKKAKGRDKGGKEWARRAQEAHDEIKKNGRVDA
jgi:hypothetical protein